MIERLKKFLIFFIFFCSLLNLSACSKTSYFDTYVGRLEHLLGENVKGAEKLVSSSLPRQVVVSQESSVASIDLLDFLALSSCKLQQIVAQRNSVLGKVAPGSQKLINELLFLNLAPECLAQLDPNDQVLKAYWRAQNISNNSNICWSNL